MAIRIVPLDAKANRAIGEKRSAPLIRPPRLHSTIGGGPPRALIAATSFVYSAFRTEFRAGSDNLTSASRTFIGCYSAVIHEVIDLLPDNPLA